MNWATAMQIVIVSALIVAGVGWATWFDWRFLALASGFIAIWLMVAVCAMHEAVHRMTAEESESEPDDPSLSYATYLFNKDD